MKKKMFNYLLKNKKNIIIFFSFFVFLFLLLDLSVFGSWWKIWPRPIKSRIAINRLAVSVYNNPYCRDLCYFEQLDYEKEIIKSLKSKAIFKKLSNIVFNEEDNLNWRLRVIDIISKNKDSKFIPVFIESSQNYIDSDSANNIVREALILKFKDFLDPSNYIEKAGNMLLESSMSEDERKSFLNIISKVDNSFNFRNLADVSIDKDLIIFISDNYNYFYSDINSYFSFLKEQFFENINNPEIKNIIIFILSSYLDSPEKNLSINFLNEIYKDERIDIFSKYIIAEVLNYSDELPGISESEWNYYYGSF
ncbi:MAG: hypothetical protein WC280_03350 [Patescibacteria group bacterium]